MGPCWKVIDFFREVGPYENVRFQLKLKKIWGAKMTKNGDPKFGTFWANFQERSISVNFGQFRTKWGHVEKSSIFFVRSVLTKMIVFSSNWGKSEGPKWPKMGSPNLEIFWLIFKKGPFLSILVNFGQNGAMLKNLKFFSWGRSLRKWSFSVHIEENLRCQKDQKCGPQIWKFFG